MPTFEHDCDNCTFLGTYAGHVPGVPTQHRDFDLYVCVRTDQVFPVEVIARYGPDGDYYAAAVDSPGLAANDALEVARLRALAG